MEVVEGDVDGHKVLVEAVEKIAEVRQNGMHAIHGVSRQNLHRYTKSTCEEL